MPWWLEAIAVIPAGVAGALIGAWLVDTTRRWWR